MSPRRQQIEEHLDAEGKHGAAAAQIAAHRTRDAKEPLSHEELLNALAAEEDEEEEQEP